MSINLQKQVRTRNGFVQLFAQFYFLRFFFLFFHLFLLVCADVLARLYLTPFSLSCLFVYLSYNR